MTADHQTTADHTPNPRLAERAKAGPHLRKDEHVGFNGRVAILITNSVGTMWCAYAFAVLALISLPDAIKAGTAALIGWIAQTFLQLVLLSVIMVGQKVSAAASDKQALQTYKDAEALLKIQDDVHRLIKVNNDLTAQIHAATCTGPAPAPAPAATAKSKAAPRARTAKTAK
jgi:ABC-type nickel/cobalt efflux system permease component RcnA